MLPLAFAGKDFFQAFNYNVLAPTITLTRPNNVVAYAAGQVYGAAGDARFTIPVPAIPADSEWPYFPVLYITLVQGTGWGQGAVTFNLALAAQPYTTVIGDQAAFNVSDAEILTMFPSVSSGVTMSWALTVSAVTQLLNGAATIAGRRGVENNYNGTSYQPIVSGTTLGGYLWVGQAYAPLALETVQLVPSFNYYRKAVL